MRNLRPNWPPMPGMGILPEKKWWREPCRLQVIIWLMILAVVLMSVGCGAINVGKWQGLVKTASDEKYYLLKEILLTGGSVFNPRDSFDHQIHDSVSLFFVPRNEKNVYVAKSVWQDPDGLEFRTIRTTYDKLKERDQGEERQKKGTTRVHSISTRELYDHKPGLWKVLLYLDGELARRLTFSVR